MANNDQLKALLKAYANGDQQSFYTASMQIAAAEARAGNTKFAEQLRSIIDEARVKLPSAIPTAIPLARPKGEVADLLSVRYPNTKLSDLVLDPRTHKAILRVLKEHRTIRDIRAHGLSPRRKLLLVGPPGTGKTLTAAALAGELGLPLFEVRLDRLITRFMGETAAKLRMIFDAIAQTRAVYLFDEFDSIGSERGLANDVGEIRRVVNSFLMMVEQDASDSLIVAATNHPEILDRALFRRFDDRIEYHLPTVDEIKQALKTKLASRKLVKPQWARLAKIADGLNYADITRAVEDAIKHALIEKRPLINGDVAMSLRERAESARSQNK